VLADVPQHFEIRELRQPVDVVDQLGLPLPGAEVEQTLEDRSLTGDVGFYLLARLQAALTVLARRIADQARAATHQRDRAMARRLKPP
jgi:hypothetical protein